MPPTLVLNNYAIIYTSDCFKLYKVLGSYILYCNCNCNYCHCTKQDAQLKTKVRRNPNLMFFHTLFPTYSLPTTVAAASESESWYC